jgi:deoxyribodipyrimidine photo-lyase
MISLSELSTIVSPNISLFWFRRDLRLTDNAGLYHALKKEPYVLPIFIFDTGILNKLEDKKDRRVEFIHQRLAQLKEELEQAGSSLLALHGNPVEIYSILKPKAVYCNHDYEPYANARDLEIKNSLTERGIEFHSFKDQVIFEKSEITKDNGIPYTIFTPYSIKWKSKLNKFYLKSYPSEKRLTNLSKLSPLVFPSLSQIGFEKTDSTFPERKIQLKIIENYNTTRDYPSVNGTSRLSVHLRFGTVSIRKLASIAFQKNETWLNELIWREFYQMILWHFPQVENEPFKSAYQFIEWRNDQSEFEAWCEGRTGYPIVDAGMRELNQTGYMHNRLRMIVASFLTKHLLIDWRWGEAYFAKTLLDFDLAANNGGWQWAAGCGCDAAPYFRVFNPLLQTVKFDHDMKYVKKWIPEFGSSTYLKPIVNHEFARRRVLAAYKKALSVSA